MTDAEITGIEHWLAMPTELMQGLRDALVGDMPSGGIGALPAAERLTLTVEECADLLGISRAFAYEQVNAGTIPSIRIGRRILIPKVALERLLSG